MGTRGAFGVRIDGVDKLTYNHCGSYPAGLGLAVARFAKAAAIKLDDARERARNLRVITESDVPPTDEDRQRLSQWHDARVGGDRAIDEWYRLLRGTQGDLFAVLDAGALLDSASFIRDSLFCEWAYIVNLDDCAFEVYRGWQKSPHEKGRYASQTAERGYYPCALIASYPLGSIPRNWTRRVEKIAEQSREEARR